MKQLIEKAIRAHDQRLELGIDCDKSLQSLIIELQHILKPEISKGRVS